MSNLPTVANRVTPVPATRYQRYHVEVTNGSVVVARHHFITRQEAKRYAEKVTAQGLYKLTLLPDGTVIHPCNDACEDAES